MLVAVVLLYLAMAFVVDFFMLDPAKAGPPVYQLEGQHTAVVGLRKAIPLLWLPLLILVPLVMLPGPLCRRFVRRAYRA